MAIFATLAYFIVPVDLIPDVVPMKRRLSSGGGRTKFGFVTVRVALVVFSFVSAVSRWRYFVLEACIGVLENGGTSTKMLVYK